MRIAIAGGLGFTGKHIVAALLESGHDVTVFDNRDESEFSFEGACYVHSNLINPGAWQKYINENDAVINLAGVNIFQRWNDTVKKLIHDSRIRITRNIVDSIPESGGQVKVLINASAVGYYGFRGDEDVDESFPPGEDFLARICRDWENEAMEGAKKIPRIVRLRFGAVLGKNGGAFPDLKKTFQSFAGAKLGSGKQWFSWIHVDDIVGIVLKAIDDAEMSGPYNCTAPGIVTNRGLTKAMSEATGKPVIIPFVPALMLRLILGEFGSVLTRGQKALPVKLLNQGYRFKYPELAQALDDLVK